MTPRVTRLLDPLPSPPAPTEAELADPDYRYLGCTKAWCCTGIRQDLVADWVLAGCPHGWHHQFGNLAMAGYTAAQVAAYAPPASWGNATGLGVLGHLFEFLANGVSPRAVYDFHLGYVHDGSNILTLHKFGCDPDIVIDYVPAVLATQQNTVNVGARFTRWYTDWMRSGASPGMIAAFLTDRPHPSDVGPALRGWAATLLDPAVAVRLHKAGVTPAEAIANPDLATADSKVLAAMAALR